jgi:hypothetical protein
MKQNIKEVLKRIKIYSFKWDKDPIKIFKELQDTATEDITLKNQIFKKYLNG